jgi:hypothetical protein
MEKGTELLLFAEKGKNISLVPSSQTAPRHSERCVLHFHDDCQKQRNLGAFLRKQSEVIEGLTC